MSSLSAAQLLDWAVERFTQATALLNSSTSLEDLSDQGFLAYLGLGKALLIQYQAAAASAGGEALLNQAETALLKGVAALAKITAKSAFSKSSLVWLIVS